MARMTMLAMLAALLVAAPAAAKTHLELGLGLSPTLVQDTAFEAFSEDDTRAARFGADVRVEVASFWRNIKLLPVVGYRVALDEGSPYYLLDTAIDAHDFFAGLRLRAWFRPWLATYLQATGGVCWVRVEGEANDVWAASARSTYRADDATWSVEGLLGLEFRLSPVMLERRGVRRFNFGGEIGAGYARRGLVELEPSLGGGDEHSLPVRDSEGWGDLNLSGWVFQVGVTLSFF